MNWIKNLLLLLITFVICYVLLMGGDILLNRYLDRQKFLPFKEAFDIEMQRYNNEDMVYKRQARNNGYWPRMFPVFFDDHAPMQNVVDDIGAALIAGPPNKKTYYCNEGYGLVTYKSDRFGFRNQDSKWDKEVEVLFIGDSFVQGGCVDDESTIPQLFEYKTGCNTLGLGIDGNNPSHYATYANLFIPQARPKTVFMVFYPNDKDQRDSIIHDIYVKEGKPYFLGDELKLAHPQKAKKLYIKAIVAERRLATPETNIIDKLLRSFNYRKSLPTIRLLISNLDDNIIGSSRDALIDAKKLCDEIDCELNVVYIPNSNYWRPDDLADEYADKLKSVADEMSISFFDARQVINREKGSPDYAPKGFHLSPDGYRKVINLILREYGETFCKHVSQVNSPRYRKLTVDQLAAHSGG